MVSLDKLEIKLTMKTINVVAVDKVAKMVGMSRASVINGYVEDGLKRAKVKLTVADYARVDEIRAQNAAKREVKKIKKGGSR
jgi:flavin-binding protein dodecin